jgi:hypothetical protein
MTMISMSPVEHADLQVQEGRSLEAWVALF